jgi:hypothetical protein
MQFYVDRDVADGDLCSVLASITGFQVGLLSDPEVADVTIELSRIPGAFPLDLMLVWRDGTHPATGALGIAQGLATRLFAHVATHLPRSHPSAHDPYCWCVAEPTGEIVQMDEDMEGIEHREGLILDRRTRRPLLGP